MRRLPAQLRPLWARAVEFIALNDEPMELDFQTVCGFISTVTVAAAFEVDVGRVAAAVLRIRRKDAKNRASQKSS